MPNNPFMPGVAPQMSGPAATTGNMPMPGSAPAPASDTFEVDLSGVESNSFTIPDGNYKVRCTEIEQSVSKGGNPMFVWTFVVSEGPHTGFQSKVFTAITPAAMWKVAETVVALGVGQQGQMVKFKRSDVLNRECGAIIEKTEYNGKTNSQIQRLISLKELAESRS